MVDFSLCNLDMADMQEHILMKMYSAGRRDGERSHQRGGPEYLMALRMQSPTNGLAEKGTRSVVHRYEADDAASDTSSTHSWPSTAAPIDPQDHCVERQQEREVTDREIQRVVKHGIRQPDPQGDPQRAKQTFEGVTVITRGTRVITTWRKSSEWEKSPLRSPLERAEFRAGGSLRAC